MFGLFCIFDTFCLVVYFFLFILYGSRNDSFIFLIDLYWSIIASQLLCQFLLYTKANQPYAYICPHIPSVLSLPPILPIPPLQVIAKHRADLPVLCCCFPLANCFTFGSVYMSMLLSLCPTPPSTHCPQVHSLCLHLYSHPETRFISTIFKIFRFHIYALEYGICFSLSDVLHSV